MKVGEGNSMVVLCRELRQTLHSNPKSNQILFLHKAGIVEHSTDLGTWEVDHKTILCLDLIWTT